jgi:hypothetical protein
MRRVVIAKHHGSPGDLPILNRAANRKDSDRGVAIAQDMTFDLIQVFLPLFT